MALYLRCVALGLRASEADALGLGQLVPDVDVVPGVLGEGMLVQPLLARLPGRLLLQPATVLAGPADEELALARPLIDSGLQEGCPFAMRDEDNAPGPLLPCVRAVGLLDARRQRGARCARCGDVLFVG